LRFPVTDADRTELSRLRTSHPRLAGPYAVLHPGGTLPDRRWPPDRFAAVAERLAATGLGVAVTGTATEASLVDAVVATARAPIVGLAGATSLGGLAALLADAEVAVTNDTGTSHLAAAVGARGVTVFLVTDPARWAPVDRDRHAVVDARDGRDVTAEVLAAALA
jgi:ADP-heptose:LPS heptosyltransferase